MIDSIKDILEGYTNWDDEEEVRAYHARYYKANKERKKKFDAERYKKNKEKHKQRNAKRSAKIKEKLESYDAMEAKLREIVEMLPEIRWFVEGYKRLHQSTLAPDLVKRDALKAKLTKWEEGE